MYASNRVAAGASGVERSDLPIEFSNRVFEHAPVVRCACHLKIGQCTRAGQHEGGALAVSSGVADRGCRSFLATIRRGFLLSLDGFALPASRHPFKLIAEVPDLYAVLQLLR